MEDKAILSSSKCSSLSTNINCSFSSPFLTNDHKSKNVCNPKEGTSFIGCGQCISGRILYRCLLCMATLVNTIDNYEKSKVNNNKMICSHATSIARKIDWKDMNSNGNIPSSVVVDGKQTTVPIQLESTIGNAKIYKWNRQCPCCDSIDFPPQPSLPCPITAPTTSPNTINIPKLQHTVVTKDNESIDVESVVQVVVLAPVMSSADEKKFKY